MSEVELLLAFLAGVVMAARSTASCSRSSLTRGSTDCAGMGDERLDDADKRRADVCSSARIGAAAALTIVLVVLLVLDVAVPDYDISPGILLPLLGAILALLGLEASEFWSRVRCTIWGREPAMVLALVQAVIALVVAFGLSLAPDQIGAILAVTAVILGLVTRSRVSPVS